jgi:hypothetical protein
VHSRLASVVDDGCDLVIRQFGDFLSTLASAFHTPEKLIAHFFYGVRQRQGGLQHDE